MIKLAAIGVAAGAFSALFGVGGGTVIVPLLIFWLGYGERRATATSLGAIVIIAALAAAGQAPYGNVEVGNAALLAGPAIVGVGARRRAPAAAARAGRLAALRAAADRRRHRADRPLMERDVCSQRCCALAGGAVGGLLGVGGGIVFVPALAIVARRSSQLEAEATSLLAIVPMAIVGTWRQHRYGNVELARRGGDRRCSRSPASPPGSLLANTLPQRALELGFAGLILFVACAARRAGRCRRTPAPAERPPMAEPIEIAPGVAIDAAEIELRASRSGGPGGQHANVTASRVEASFDIAASASLSRGAEATPVGPRSARVVTAVSQDSRSQARNRELAIERLAERLAGGAEAAPHAAADRTPKASASGGGWRRSATGGERKRARGASRAPRRPATGAAQRRPCSSAPLTPASSALRR